MSRILPFTSGVSARHFAVHRLCASALLSESAVTSMSNKNIHPVRQCRLENQCVF